MFEDGSPAPGSVCTPSVVSLGGESMCVSIVEGKVWVAVDDSMSPVCRVLLSSDVEVLRSLSDLFGRKNCTNCGPFLSSLSDGNTGLGVNRPPCLGPLPRRFIGADCAVTD